MLLEEYNETEVMELFREEGREEGIGIGRGIGREEGIGIGREEGELNMLLNLAGKKLITIEQAAEEAGMSVNEFIEKMKVA